MKNILVIGGGGVFANHTAEYLLKHGAEKVVAVGRNPRLRECYNLNIGVGDPRFEYQQAHIVFEQKRLFELFDQYQPDCVLNFAALAYTNSWYDAVHFYNTNCTAVVQMVEFLKEKKYLKKFCQIGTSEMYGSTISHPAKESDPINATSPYAISKLAADLHLESMFKVKGFPMNIIRPSNCYGPGQYVYRIIPKAILCILNNKPFPLEGGGVAEKSFMYVEDLAESVHLIINKGTMGETYNVGSDEPVSMKKIVVEVCKQLGKDEGEFIKITEGRAGEDRKYWIDSSKIKAELKWAPKVSLEQGIAHMIDWVKQYKDELMKDPDYFVLRA